VLEIAFGGSAGHGLPDDRGKINHVTLRPSLDEMIEKKKRIVAAILRRMKTKRPNLHFRRLNVLNYGDMESACHIFKVGNVAGVLWSEGLMPYLTDEEKKGCRNKHTPTSNEAWLVYG